jgi:hypothetical protein
MRGKRRTCSAVGVRWRAPLLVAVALLAVLGGASSASAMLFQKNFAPFANCPVNTPGVRLCVVSTVTGGEFHLGNNTVPINKTITLQGGLVAKTGELVPATNGETLSRTPLTLPGGLLGIALLGDLTEVTATAELAGTVLINVNNLGGAGPAVSPLPLKVKLDNPLLGNACFIGSDSEPISLSLTTGTTNPPPPNVPIHGNPGNVVIRAEGRVDEITENSLVDNAFAAPGANGCGGILSIVVDPSVDLKAGLPAAAGMNTAIMNGSLMQAEARIVKTESEIPLFGRCTKVEGVKEGKTTIYNGKYSSANCVTEAVESLAPGKYEWTAGPGSHRKFTGTGELTTLETTGKAKVKCSVVSSSGEFTGQKTASASLTFKGCEGASLLHGACQSSGAVAGEIHTVTLSGELGFIKDSEPLLPVVGLDLEPGGGAPHVAQFECSGTVVTLDGSVIGTLTPSSKMTSALTLKFAQGKGAQKPEAFEEGPKDVLTATVGASSEGAGLTSKTLNATEEPIEVKARAF